MFKCVVVSALGFCLAQSVEAQGYVGAVAALTSVGLDCSGHDTCDKKGFGVKLYAGSPISKENRVDLGVGVVDAVEFGLINFGKGGGAHTVTYIDLNSGSPFDQSVSTVGTANAIFGAFVARFAVVDTISLLVKPGLAYVSSTQRYYIGSNSNGSETATKLQPYLGFGAELNVDSKFKLVGSFDWTRYDVGSKKSNLTSLGLGAEIGF